MLSSILPLTLLLACQDPPPPSPLGASQLLVFHSSDGQRYVQESGPQGGVLAQGFDSLGLVVQEREGGTERVVLLGLDHRRKIPWWERYQAPAVQTLEQVDDGWVRGELVFAELDAPALVDPQLDEQGLWYVARQGTGDPALGGDNRVMHGQQVVLEGPGLADPMGLEFAGQALLFTTLWGEGVVLWAGEPLSKTRVWPSLTVPYVRVQGDTLELYAVGVVAGRRLPVVLRSRDGAHFSAPQALVLEPTPSSCTSPVVHHGAQGWWLYCVQEAPQPAGPGTLPR